MVSNDMTEILTNSTSPSPLDTNGLCHMSNYYFDLSRVLYYKTSTKMDSKGLQQFIWKVLSFEISISNGLQQNQKLLELKIPLQRTPMVSTICMLLIYLLFSDMSVDIPYTMDSNGLQ